MKNTQERERARERETEKPFIAQVQNKIAVGTLGVNGWIHGEIILVRVMCVVLGILFRI